MTSPALASLLSKSIRKGRVLTAPAQLAGYDADGLGYRTFRPDAVVIPADAGELAALLSGSARLNVPVTMRGAGTSLSGGPVAAQGGVVVHTSSLRSIRTISRAGLWCEVECSVALSQLDAALAPQGLFYPPDPSSGAVCTLGGNVAMNAGGARCFRYGVTSNYVLGMEAVLLDGTVRRFGGPAGGRGAWREDWKRLMVGSEGTLAAFTRIWLRLLPRPEKAWTYRAPFRDLKSAERAVQRMAAHASFPVAIELMDPRCVAMVENSPMACGLPGDAYLLVGEIDGPAELADHRAPEVAELLKEAGAVTVEMSDDESERKRLWKARKVAGGLMGQLSPDFLVQDAVIPKRALAEILELVYREADEAGLRVVNVFHAGDGNLHPNFLFDSQKPGELHKVEAISKRLMERVVAVGGTLSGEHGIGNDKTDYMPLVFDAETLRLQLAVPKVFNPRHQLNPLKVFSSRRFLNGTANGSASNGAVDDAPGKTVPSSPGPRLFAPFFDEIDGVWCGPANVTPRDLEAIRQTHRQRFPLWLDATAPLCEQVRASGYAPGSSRFGPYVDNITGMNWRLRDGRVVRIGERVVKSTTGYDLLRFLLQSNGEFGEPVDYVLRLRPDCGETTCFRLRGNRQRVDAAAAEILQSSWLNWFDAVDVLFEGTGEPVLQLTLNARPEETPVSAEFVRRVAGKQGLSCEADATDGMGRCEGLPDFMLKTTADRAIGLAERVASQHGIRTAALVYPGVVHGWFAGSDGTPIDSRQLSERVRSVIGELGDELAQSGGDWQSRHLVRPPATGVEAEWLTGLLREFASR